MEKSIDNEQYAMIYTIPYSPQTNGPVENFFGTTKSKFVKLGYVAHGDQEEILNEVRELVITILKQDPSETYESYYKNVINVWQDCINMVPLSADKPQSNITLEKVLNAIETRRYPGTYQKASEKILKHNQE